MRAIYVDTPAGPGRVWGIGPNCVLVEMDYMYLVPFALDQVIPYEPI